MMPFDIAAAILDILIVWIHQYLYLVYRYYNDECLVIVNSDITIYCLLRYYLNISAMINHYIFTAYIDSLDILILDSLTNIILTMSIMYIEIK